jgi:hypothetical protein
MCTCHACTVRVTTVYCLFMIVYRVFRRNEKKAKLGAADSISQRCSCARQYDPLIAQTEPLSNGRTSRGRINRTPGDGGRRGNWQSRERHHHHHTIHPPNTATTLRRARARPCAASFPPGGTNNLLVLGRTPRAPPTYPPGAARKCARGRGDAGRWRA